MWFECARVSSRGTTPSSAARIVENGLKPGTSGAAFLAEDFDTARYFGIMAKGDRSAKGVTVLEYSVPQDVSAQMLRGPIGEYSGVRFEDLGSGFERILPRGGSGVSNPLGLDAFNEAVRQGVITVRRLRVR